MNKHIYTLGLAALFALSGNQAAMAAQHGHAMDHGAMAMSEVAATGEVRGIQADKGKIKIKHDPIPNLGWPMMVMDFKVADAKLLKGLKAGDRVDFTMREQAPGYLITAIRKAGK